MKMEEKTPSRESTGVRINAELWQKVKVKATQEKMKYSDALEEALEDWLKKKKPQ